MRIRLIMIFSLDSKQKWHRILFRQFGIVLICMMTAVCLYANLLENRLKKMVF